MPAFDGQWFEPMWPGTFLAPFGKSFSVGDVWMIWMMQAVLDPLREGLCANCRHRRRIRSGRDSVFTMCRRAATDPGYVRYPRLPVLQCRGYERGESSPDKQAEGN